MAKKKQARKYVTVSVLREYLNDVDDFMNDSPYGKLFTSRSDFVHRALEEKLEYYYDREARNESHKLFSWYNKNIRMLEKRGIDSWEHLLEKSLRYAERLGK